MNPPYLDDSTITPHDAGQWWTRIRLPEGVRAEVRRERGFDHVCLYGPSGQAIQDVLRDWAAYPAFEFDPPERPS